MTLGENTIEVGFSHQQPGSTVGFGKDVTSADVLVVFNLSLPCIIDKHGRGVALWDLRRKRSV